MELPLAPGLGVVVGRSSSSLKESQSRMLSWVFPNEPLVSAMRTSNPPQTANFGPAAR